MTSSQTDASSRAVLMSVKPSYANLLVSGAKTIELRKRFPSDLPHGTRIIIYSSSPEMAVIGEVEISQVEKLEIRNLWSRAAIEAMISWEDFKEYFKGLDYGYAISVQKAKRYEKKKPLEDFESLGVTSPPQSFQYITTSEGLIPRW
jgi:predicted transcriptional regulator